MTVLDGKSLLRFVARLTELRPTLMPMISYTNSIFSSSPSATIVSIGSMPSMSAISSGELTPRGEAAALSNNSSFRIDFDTFLRVLLEIDHLLDEHHIRTLFKAPQPRAVNGSPVVCALDPVG
jgi:hypothetical protein